LCVTHFFANIDNSTILIVGLFKFFELKFQKDAFCKIDDPNNLIIYIRKRHIFIIYDTDVCSRTILKKMLFFKIKNAELFM
jgi:hypothetical protein